MAQSSPRLRAAAHLGSVSGAQAQLDKLYAAAGSGPSSPFLESTTWLHAMLVEANYARLTQVKAAYDPDRVFTFPQAV